MCVSLSQGRTGLCVSSSDREDREEDQLQDRSMATKLIVKLPLIMFCVLWLVHMIDSPPPFSSPLHYALVLLRE